VPTVLIATDADWIHDEVEAALADDETTVVHVREGRDVEAAVRDHQPVLAVLDLQIGNMGGIAACLNLRHEEGAERLPHVPVLVLLDRPADVFLARRSDAEGWLIKPLDAFRLRRAAGALIAGGEWHESSGLEGPEHPEKLEAPQAEVDPPATPEPAST
jgi:two-component system nitrate/nitrite response regulator NarL